MSQTVEELHQLSQRLREEYRKPLRQIRTTHTFEEFEQAFVAMMKSLVADAKDLPRIRAEITVNSKTHWSFEWYHYNRGGGHFILSGPKKQLDLVVLPAEYRIESLQKFKTRVQVPFTLSPERKKDLTEQVEGFFT